MRKKPNFRSFIISFLIKHNCSQPSIKILLIQSFFHLDFPNSYFFCFKLSQRHVLFLLRACFWILKEEVYHGGCHTMVWRFWEGDWFLIQAATLIFFPAHCIVALSSNYSPGVFGMQLFRFLPCISFPQKYSYFENDEHAANCTKALENEKQIMPSKTAPLIPVEVMQTLLNLIMKPRFKNYDSSDFDRDQTSMTMSDVWKLGYFYSQNPIFTCKSITNRVGFVSGYFIDCLLVPVLKIDICTESQHYQARRDL